MPRDYATLPITYWQELKDAHLSSNEILVETFLHTGPNSTSTGIFIEHPDTIVHYTDLTIDEVKQALYGLELHNRVKRFPGNWVFVVNRWKLEPSKSSPQFLKGTDNLLKKTPKETQIAFHMEYPEFIETLLQKCARCNEIPYRGTDTETKTVPVKKAQNRNHRKGPAKKNMLTDPNVSDAEAVAYGCIDFPDDPDN